MFYKKIKTKYSTIEFHTNWLGVESVIISGQIVSKKKSTLKSILGTSHYFTVLEEGHVIPYILTTKWDHSGSYGKYYLDLRRNGKLIKENVHVRFNSKPKQDNNEFKQLGIKYINEYDIKQAIISFEKALHFDNEDPEIYFHLACCYSIEEQTNKGFDCIRKAVEYKLNDIEMILNHEMLAFLRINDAFEDFLNSNFTKYEL